MLDAVERDTHGHLKLSSWEVDTGDHLGCWMLDLKTGIELEEVEHVFGVAIEVCSAAMSYAFPSMTV